MLESANRSVFRLETINSVNGNVIVIFGNDTGTEIVGNSPITFLFDVNEYYDFETIESSFKRLSIHTDGKTLEIKNSP